MNVWWEMFVCPILVEKSRSPKINCRNKYSPSDSLIGNELTSVACWQVLSIFAFTGNCIYFSFDRGNQFPTGQFFIFDKMCDSSVGTQISLKWQRPILSLTEHFWLRESKQGSRLVICFPAKGVARRWRCCFGSRHAGVSKLCRVLIWVTFSDSWQLFTKLDYYWVRYPRTALLTDSSRLLGYLCHVVLIEKPFIFEVSATLPN